MKHEVKNQAFSLNPRFQNFNSNPMYYMTSKKFSLNKNIQQNIEKKTYAKQILNYNYVNISVEHSNIILETYLYFFFGVFSDFIDDINLILHDLPPIDV